MPIRSRRQYEILPKALVITPLQLSGEDARVVAMMVGTADSPGRLIVCPNRRDPAEQLAMFRKISQIALPWWARRVAAGEFPQVWVGSTAAADLLDANLRYMSHHDGRKVPQQARQADAANVDPDEPEAEIRERARCEATGAMGDLFAYLSRRRAHAIQMCFMVATERLSECFITGQHDGLDQHLGSLLTWIEPPAGDLFTALRRIEQLPYGRKTDPKTDEDLEAILGAYSETTQTGHARDARAVVKQLEDHLRPMVERIHEATRRAIAILRNVPKGSYAGDLCSIERQEFAYFREHDASKGYPIFDGRAYAAASLLQQEADADTAAAIGIHDDPLIRAQALMRGEVIRGRVTAASDNGAKRRCEKRITLETPQENLRVHLYDTVHEIGESEVHLIATAISGGTGGGTVVELEAGSGKTKWQVPQVGSIVEYADKAPNVARAGRTKPTVLARLKGSLPWTHQSPRTRGPARTPVPLAPHHIDPLAVLRALK